jgi:hypothetical protein
MKNAIFQARRDHAADQYYHSMRSQSDWAEFQEAIDAIERSKYEQSRRDQRLASKFDAMESRRRELNWGEAC